MYSYCMFMYLHRASWHSSATLTEVFPCLFLSCKANARVKPVKMGTARTLPNFLCCSVYCLCVNVYCTAATGWLPTAVNKYITSCRYYITGWRLTSMTSRYFCVNCALICTPNRRDVVSLTLRTATTLVFLFFCLHLLLVKYKGLSPIIKTNKCTNMYCIILKHTLKHLKSSYMFRSMIIIREHT
jgi:hypothetical protein